jgi:RimJ/RimL family protein N-acetyltransferase
MRAVMALLFEQLAHHRLIAVVDTRNTGAIKLLEGAFVARRITGRISF